MKNKIKIINTKFKYIFIIIFSLFLPTKIFCQEVKNETTIVKKKFIEYIYITDIIKNENNAFSIDKVVKMMNGRKREVDVKYTVKFSEYEPTESDLDKININMEHLLWLTVFNLKNKFSFEPYEVNVYRNIDFWSIYLKYTAKNDYGIEKDGLKVYKFDLKGREIK